MKCRVLLGIGFLFFAAGCQTSNPIPANPAALAAYKTAQNEMAVAEALFRYQFEHNYSAIQHGAEVYFLLLNGTNPPECFMERFDENPVPVKVRSRSEDGFMTDYVRDRDQPKKRGILFSINDIKIDGNQAVATGGHYESPHSRATIIYRMECINGDWQVKDKEIQRMI